MQVLTPARNQNKENQNAEPAKEIQKLRVQLNDRNFELHKLEEDHAQEKARIFIQLQKEKQNHAKTIKELKDKIKEDNEGWVRMIDHIRTEKEEAMTALKTQLQGQCHNEITRAVDELQISHQKQVASLKQEIMHGEHLRKRREEEIMRDSKVAAQHALLNFQRQLQEKEKKHRAAMTENKKQYQQHLTKLQSMYRKEEYGRQQAELELQEAIKSHVKEKITWEHCQSDLCLQVDTLQQKIIELEAMINQLKKDMSAMEQSHLLHIEQIQASSSNKIKQLEQENCERQKEHSHFYSAEIQNLKVEIDKLIDIHKRKEESWLESGRMVLQLYQKRESKKEDVKAIQKLQVELIKKDFLIERERKELKNCKLQLQNMEEIYDRIFIYNSNLNRSKVKNYQIKKLKTSCQLNQSNRSTILSDKLPDKRYPCDRNE